MTEVVFHERRGVGLFSIEEYFATVRAHLPADIRWRVAHSRWPSRGLLPRVGIIVDAVRRQGAVNHITGDIHYVAFGLPKQTTVLTLLDCGFEQRLRGLRREVYQAIWFTWPERRVARITTISQFTKDRLMSLFGWPSERIDVIPVCIPSGFTPRPKPFPAVRPVVLQVGTRPNKNIERLAVAMRGLECDLRVVGLLTREQKAVLAQNGVRYTSVENLSRAASVEEYERADLVVFASTYEGFGMPIVEAQAVGRPVITSTVAAMPEVAGEAAVLVDPYDPDAIRTALHRLLTEPGLRERLVTAGFVNIRRFEPDAIAQAYARLYRSVARESGARDTEG